MNRLKPQTLVKELRSKHECLQFGIPIEKKTLQRLLRESAYLVDKLIKEKI